MNILSICLIYFAIGFPVAWLGVWLLFMFADRPGEFGDDELENYFDIARNIPAAKVIMVVTSAPIWPLVLIFMLCMVSITIEFSLRRMDNENDY